MPQGFSRTANQFLGALSELDEFPLNSQVRVKTGTAPGYSRNSDRENQEPKVDRFQNDPHPEANTYINKSRESTNLDPAAVHHKTHTFDVEASVRR